MSIEAHGIAIMRPEVRRKAESKSCSVALSDSGIEYHLISKVGHIH